MSTFYVKIEMGNVGMYSNQDVRYALKYIIGHLDCNMGGAIRDINGNVVGEYGYRDCFNPRAREGCDEICEDLVITEKVKK